MVITPSKFNMMRAIVHMAHLDSHVADDETRMIQGYLDRMPFSEEQLAILRKELSEGLGSIDEIFKGITDPADRSMVVHFSRVLCFCDGHLHPKEKEVLDHIGVKALGSADVQVAVADARAAALDSFARSERRPKFLLEKFCEWLASK